MNAGRGPDRPDLNRRARSPSRSRLLRESRRHHGESSAARIHPVKSRRPTAGSRPPRASARRLPSLGLGLPDRRPRPDYFWTSQADQGNARSPYSPWFLEQIRSPTTSESLTRSPGSRSTGQLRANDGPLRPPRAERPDPQRGGVLQHRLRLRNIQIQGARRGAGRACKVVKAAGLEGRGQDPRVRPGSSAEAPQNGQQPRLDHLPPADPAGSSGSST